MNTKIRAKDLVAQMTLEEKASLCSGGSAWTLKGIERLGLPEIFIHRRPSRPAQAERHEPERFRTRHLLPHSLRHSLFL